jgi:hypothetical protein
MLGTSRRSGSTSGDSWVRKIRAWTTCGRKSRIAARSCR